MLHINIVQKNENLHELLSHNRCRIILREKLQTSLIVERDTTTANMSKLSFHGQYISQTMDWKINLYL